MNLTVLNWTLAIVGTLGVVGTIALVIAAPEFLDLLVKGVADFVKWMLRTRIGVAILVGILCLIVGELAGDWHGRTACRADQARADQEAAARDQQQGVLANQDAQKRIAVLEADARKSQGKINVYAKTLAARKTAACTLGTGDL